MDDFPEALDDFVGDGASGDGRASTLVDAPGTGVAGSPGPDGYPDRIDRSIVIGDMLKRVAMWCLRLLFIAAAAYVAWWVLGQFWRGVLPVLLALIVCTVLAIPNGWLRKLGLPRALAALLTILMTLVVAALVVVLIAPSIGRQSQTLYYQAYDGIQRLQVWLQVGPLNLNPDDLDQVFNEAAAWLQNQAGTIAGEIFSGLGIATTVLVTLGVMLVLTFFFLKDGDRFLPWARNLTGQTAGWHLTELLTRSWMTLSGFIRAQAIVSAVDAIFIGIGLVLIGVPMAFALAVITFIAGFIPIVGAFTAGALAVLVALMSLGFTEAIITLILVIAVQQLEGNILSPILQAKAMNLHAAVVLLSVTVGGTLFNIIGAFLAVPVAAVLAVLLRYIQDVTTLRSGEKTTDDVHWVTEYGRLGGLYTEAQGARFRAEHHENLLLARNGGVQPSEALRFESHDDEPDDAAERRREALRRSAHSASTLVGRAFDKIRRR